MKTNTPYTRELYAWLENLPAAEREAFAREVLARAKAGRLPATEAEIAGHDEEEIEGDEIDGDARWEELLADPRSDVLLDQMAEESKQARREGKLIPISDLFEEYAHLLDKKK